MRATAFICALLLAGCAEYKIEKQVRESLKDPDSARFGEMSNSEDGAIACGTVNAKNGFGGYTGDQTFMLHEGEVRFTGPNEQWVDLADCCFEALARSKGLPLDPERAASCRRLTPVVQLDAVAGS